MKTLRGCHKKDESKKNQGWARGKRAKDDLLMLSYRGMDKDGSKRKGEPFKTMLERNR